MVKQAKKVNIMTEVGKKNISKIMRKVYKKHQKVIHPAKKVSIIFWFSKWFSTSALEGARHSGWKFSILGLW